MALSALHSAATGLSSLNTALDVTANNLANVNTDAFKASRANFQDLMYQEKAQPGVRTAADDQRPTGLYVGLGVKVSGTQFDFAQGALQPTGRELDVAINGEGFFQVRVEDERSQDGIAYTRAGNFVTNSEGEIVLATDTGRVLQPPLQLEEGETQVAISADGTVSAGRPGDPTLRLVGTIQLANFINPAGLEPIGENLYAPSEASGEPLVGEPQIEGRGSLVQGHLESSNVDPVKELVTLIRTQRAFELNSQTIQAADEVLRTVGTLRRG